MICVADSTSSDCATYETRGQTLIVVLVRGFLKSSAAPPLSNKGKSMNAACQCFLATQMFLAIVLNAIPNGLGSWFFFRYLKMDSVPMYGIIGVAADVIGTLFVLPFIICLTMTLETYRRINQGLRRGNEFPEHLVFTTKDAVRNALSRSFKLGALFTIMLAPLMIGTLHLLGVSSMNLLTFCVIKAVGTGALAAALVPSVVLRALADPWRQTDTS